MNYSQLTISQIKEEIKKCSIKDYPKLANILKLDKRNGVKKLSLKVEKNFEDYNNEIDRIQKLKEFEIKLINRGYEYIAGIDEVGRGPLAGPVVSCSVILPSNSSILYINDSKKLSQSKREILFDQIKKEAVSVGIGIIEESIIDKINIYQATKKSMIEAVINLQVKPDLLLIDAITLDNIDAKQFSVVKGDEKCYSIAAASIIAKVTRDNIMMNYHKEYPQYNFLSNKGYGTKEHIDAIKKYGITPIHRLSFLNNINTEVDIPL
ncbi:MAG: ribonuclease HII [Eubacteriaceae bacterium]